MTLTIKDVNGAHVRPSSTSGTDWSHLAAIRGATPGRAVSEED
jgi:hypothetical protein